MFRPRRLLFVAVAALACALPQAAFAQAPQWFSPPSILGPNPPAPGSVLSGENGGLYCSPACFKQVYVWYRCAAGTNYSNCIAVTEEMADKHYTVRAEDAGFSLSVQVRATNHDCNESGTECRDVTKTANSPPTAPVVPGLTISPATLPGATVGTAYSQTLTAGSGATFALSSGSLPPGLALGSGGEISGKPTAVGSFTFTVGATGDKSMGVATYTISVAYPPLTITPSALFPATPGVFYSAAIVVSGGTAPYTFAVKSGPLPAGLTIGADGTLSGIPTGAPGRFSFTVVVKDAVGAPGSKTFNLVVAAPAVVATQTALQRGVVGTPYSAALGASGGVSPYTFSLADGALPLGLSLESNGTISGTPTHAGTSLFTVRIADANNVAGMQTYRLVVSPRPVVPKKKGPAVVRKNRR
jgi:hypothetical protein